jgi:DNA-binding MarR family transcriptional regulator
MNGLELFLLGRRLAKLGEDAIPPSQFHDLATSKRAVLFDVFEHPGTTIGEVVVRTGLLQSQVSSAVTTLRGLGVFVTEADPSDRRRTLVQAAPDMAARAANRATVPIDETIASALGDAGPGDLAEVLAALDTVAARLMPHEETWVQAAKGAS